MVKILKEGNSIIIKPKRKYPKGHKLEITITQDMAVFHIDTDGGGSGPNVQLTLQEYNKLLDTLTVIRENYHLIMPLENVIKLIDTLGGD